MRRLKEVTVEVIQKCYSECIFCSSLSHAFSQNEIPIEKLHDIFRYSKEKGADTINLSGGEPLLRSDIVDILARLNDLNLKTSIYTSGNFPNTPIIEKLIQNYFPTTKLNFIFNYPTCDNEIYKKLINCINMNIRTLDNSIEMITQKGYPVEAHIVPNALNINNLFETVNQLKKLSVNRVSLLRIVYQGRANRNKDMLFLNQEKKLFLKKIIKEIEDKLCDDRFSLRVGIPFNSLVRQKCDCVAGIAKLIFRYDGIVFPCEAFKEAPDNLEYMLGNIYKDSFEDIWNNHPIHQKLGLLKREAIRMSEDCPAQLLYR